MGIRRNRIVAGLGLMLLFLLSACSSGDQRDPIENSQPPAAQPEAPATQSNPPAQGTLGAVVRDIQWRKTTVKRLERVDETYSVD